MQIFPKLWLASDVVQSCERLCPWPVGFALTPGSECQNWMELWDWCWNTSLPSATLSGFLRIHSVPSSQEFHFLLKSLATQTFTESHKDLMSRPLPVPQIMPHLLPLTGQQPKRPLSILPRTRLPPALLTLPFSFLVFSLALACLVL